MHRSWVRPFATAIALALFAASSPRVQDTDTVDTVRDYRIEHQANILRDFAELLAIPNVAHDREGIHRNANFLINEFAERGIELELLQVRGAPPLIVGSIDTPGATRTIGIYIHYDGQPADPKNWTNPPWSPTLYSAAIEAGGEPISMPAEGEDVDPEWRLYARSAGDDKAPLIALLTALDALRKSDIPLTSNIRFMFEGEEEAGSPHLREYFARFGDKLHADVWLICDGPVHQSRRPQIVFGVRGVTSFELEIYGANRNLHSGHYGNWAPNPGHMLSRLLASMKDDEGRVLIDGFYDSVEPLSATEKAALKALPTVDDALQREMGFAHSEGDGSLNERLLLPSLNIKGITSGNTGPLARNVIPSTAIANLDIRMVRGNEPQNMLDLVEAHIRDQGYHIVRQEPSAAERLKHAKIVRFSRGGGYPAARTPMDHPIVPSLIKAARSAAQQDVVLMPSLGGSLPLYLFNDMLETPTIIVPIANHDDNQHAPDENIRIANLWYGIDLMGGLLTMER